MNRDPAETTHPLEPDRRAARPQDAADDAAARPAERGADDPPSPAGDTAAPVAPSAGRPAPTPGPRDAPAWADGDLADPHAAPDKASRVRSMFAAICGSYDLNNRVHSMWRDQAWRRRTVALARVKTTDTVVDVACGTGDLAMLFARAGARRVIGLDFTHEMLQVAAAKRPMRTPARRRAPHVAYADADAGRLPLADRSVDVVSIAFGLRNVADPAAAVAEFYRVLKPGGRLVILEFSTPRFTPLRVAYNLYFHHVLPRTATWISRDRSGAYRYLPRSVDTFIDRPRITRIMGQAGFANVSLIPMTLGIAVAYSGRRLASAR